MLGAARLDDAHCVRFSRAGAVKTYESTRQMHRHVERGTGRVKSQSEVGGRFLVSFTLE